MGANYLQGSSPGEKSFRLGGMFFRYGQGRISFVASWANRMVSTWGRASSDLGRVSTWRAQSSPRHACGLNVSFFLQACTRPKPAKAGGCVRECGVGKACGSLHEWGKCQGLSRGAQAAIFRGRSGKGLVFQNGAGGVLQAPYLLGLRANFGGLVVVRSRVSNS